MMNGSWASAPYFRPGDIGSYWYSPPAKALSTTALPLIVGIILLLCMPRYAYPDKLNTVSALEPNINRKETVEPRIDQENFEITLYAGLNSVEDFGVNPVFGIRGAYHVTEDFFIEVALGFSDTKKSTIETVNQIELINDEDRDLSYYAVDIAWHIMPGEGFTFGQRTFTSQLFLISGIGSTKFAGDSASTLNLGIGYRILLNDSYAVRLDFRDYLYEYNLTGEEKRTNNFESTLGVSFFF